MAPQRPADSVYRCGCAVRRCIIKRQDRFRDTRNHQRCLRVLGSGEVSRDLRSPGASISSRLTPIEIGKSEASSLAFGIGQGERLKYESSS